MIRMLVRALPLTLLALSACAQHYHPPVIRYDDAVQATRKLPGDARITEAMSTSTCSCPMRENGSLRRA